MIAMKELDVDHVQFCLSRGITSLPLVYAAFLDALLERERKNQLCLVPSSRFDVFHLRLKPINPPRPLGERRRATR